MRHWLEPEAVFDNAEYADICKMFKAYAKEHRVSETSCEGLRIINRDLDQCPCEVPKWATLAAWLAPESVCGTAPDLVAGIALHALENKLGKVTQLRKP